MLVLEENERIALNRLLDECAKTELEDMIGLFMRHGLFRELGDGGICKLVDKIESVTLVAKGTGS